MTPLEGGVPIVVDGKIVGAVGASGVLSSQDAEVVVAGAAAAANGHIPSPQKRLLLAASLGLESQEEAVLLSALRESEPDPSATPRSGCLAALLRSAITITSAVSGDRMVVAGNVTLSAGLAAVLTSVTIIGGGNMLSASPLKPSPREMY